MSHTRLIVSHLCAYCQKRRGHQRDHLIKSNQARRSIGAQRERQNPKYIVNACSFCNEAIGTRLFVPASHEALIPELEALTLGTYRVWRGDAASLREVVR